MYQTSHRSKNIIMKYFFIILMIVSLFILIVPLTAHANEYQNNENLITLTLHGKYNQTEARKLLPLVNQARAKVNAGSLTWDTNLEKAAMIRAREAAVLYDHRRPRNTAEFDKFVPQTLEDLNTLYDGLGVDQKYYYDILCKNNFTWAQGMGENLVANLKTAGKANEAWTNSKLHYEQMIDDYNYSFGAAAFKYGKVTFWIEIFSMYTKPTGMNTAPFDGYSTGKVITTIRKSLIYTSFDHIGGSTQIVKKGKTKTMLMETEGYAEMDNHLNANIFRWSSTNKKVATVNKYGVVKGTKRGYTNIILKLLNNNGTVVASCACKVKVR